MARMVHCLKTNRELPGMDRPPMPGELGQRIYDNISQMAWEMWMEQVTILINHYGLNMADPNAQEFLNQQMEEFFFGVGAQMPEDWVPEGQGEKGGPSAKGQPSKGAPAPRQK